LIFFAVQKIDSCSKSQQVDFSGEKPPVAFLLRFSVNVADYLLVGMKFA